MSSTSRKQKRRRIDVLTRDIPHLIVEMRTSRVTGAADGSQLLALLEDLPASHGDGLQVRVEMRSAPTVTRNDDIAIATPAPGEGNLLPRRRGNDCGTDRSGQINTRMPSALMKSTGNAPIREGKNEA
jgi:hypothetical protein